MEVRNEVFRPTNDQVVAAVRSGRALGVGRNHSCPCGSGRKFKACCRPTAAEADRAELAALRARYARPVVFVRRPADVRY